MVDPSTAELEGFATLADVFNWAGLSDPLRAALNSELGDLRLIRELASLPSKDIEDSIQDLDITVEGSTRKIKAVEKTRVRLARSACRLRCGLPNDVDTSSGTAVPAPVVGTVGPPAATVGGTPALAGGSTGIELGSVWDQTSRSTVRLLGTAEVSKLYERYKTVRGSLPHPDSECSEIQLSAMKQVNDIGLPPGADFAVFGPHGNRLLRRLNFTATFIDPEGNISKRELPGPPDYPMWWACYKPYRTGNIMHNYVDTEHLDNYAEHIKSLDTNWNGKYWFLVAMADYRMRSEHFERIRRRVSHRAGSGKPRHCQGTLQLRPAAPVERSFPFSSDGDQLLGRRGQGQSTTLDQFALDSGSSRRRWNSVAGNPRGAAQAFDATSEPTSGGRSAAQASKAH